LLQLAHIPGKIFYRVIILHPGEWNLAGFNYITADFESLMTANFDSALFRGTWRPFLNIPSQS